MLKMILSALMVGLNACARFVGAVLLAPLHAIWGGGIPQDLVEIEAPQPDGSPPEDRTTIYADISRAVMTWAAHSIIADCPAPLPPGLPLGVRGWLPGLSRRECLELMEADNTAVSNHIQGFQPLAGVRPVQPLPPSGQWPAERAATDSKDFTATASLAHAPVRV